MSRLDRAPRVSERIYRSLLVVYPKQFRDAYGPHMVQVFRDLYREEVRRVGKAGLVRLWARTGLDLASTAVAERRSSHANDREMAVNERRLAGVGFALLLAPLYFVSASLLKYGLGIGFFFDPLEALLSDPQRLRHFNVGSALLVTLGGYAFLEKFAYRY